MKLTQEQLKKIINEELQKLSEMNEHEFDMMVDNVIHAALKNNMTKEGLLQTITTQWEFIEMNMDIP